MDFGDLSLSLETDAQGTGVHDSWAVSEDGSLRHHSTGIQIGARGLRGGQNPFNDINPSDIEVDQTNLLGRGAGGVVARGRYKPDGTPLAVKVVRVEDKAKRGQLINEIQYLMCVSKNAFLITLFHVYAQKDTGCVHVALEYMDYGSLADVRTRAQRVPENYLAIIMVQVLEGLKTLHLNYIVHRDVKLGNILVNSDGFVKVTDFGISKKLGEKDFCDTFVGTATHMSPERVLGEDYSYSADIWSLGLCVYELASGIYPYGNVPSFPVLFDKLCNKPEPRLENIGGDHSYSPAICDFTAKQLLKEPNKRLSAIQLQAHPYILGHIRKTTPNQCKRWLRKTMQEDSDP